MRPQRTATATGADHLVAALQDLGVETLFGLPGVHNLAVWEAAAAVGLRVLGVRHEQAAVYAADGYARATGRLGVAVVTTGPGAANTLGATGEAMASGAPRRSVGTPRWTGPVAGRSAAEPARTASAYSSPAAEITTVALVTGANRAAWSRVSCSTPR